MNNISNDVISECIIFFLDEISLFRFSMTNKQFRSCFIKGKWSIETSIKLIVHVIENDTLMDKIEKILLPIEFRCEKTNDFWPTNLHGILKKKNKENLIEWIKKSGYPYSTYTYTYTYNFRFHHYYDDDDIYIFNDDWYDEIYDDVNDCKTDEEDENNFIIKECKKKNKQINFYEIYEDEIYEDDEIDYDNETDRKKDDNICEYDENNMNDFDNSYGNVYNKNFIQKPTLWDFIVNKF